MFISTARLRRAATALGGLLALAVVAALWLDGGARRTTPVWVAIEPGPPLRYVDDETGRGGPSLSAGAAILVEVGTGTVLYARNEHDARPMASTTKMMTALVALETTPLQERVTVSPEAVRVRGSNAGLRPGQQLTMEELLYALLLPSGNDAANVVAEHVGGDVDAFVDAMNAKAALLGASRTRFANPHGLDAPNHHSSAHDLALIAATAMRFPTFRRIVDSTEFSAASLGLTWRSTNRLLFGYDDVEGIKTGYTGGAGLCLVAAASRDGMELIAVVLAGPDRWRDALALLEYGFEQFHLLTLASHGDVMAEVYPPGAAGPVHAVVDGDFRFVVRDDAVKDVHVHVVLDAVEAPVEVGQAVGRAYVRGPAGRQLQQVPLVARDRVGKLGLWGRLSRRLRDLFGRE